MHRTSQPTTLAERAQGALVGQLVGDALGSGVAGWSPERIREAHPGGVRQMLANDELGTIPGQITDKSEMSLVLARFLAGHHEYEAPAVQREYAQWASSGAAARDEAIESALRDRTVITSNTNAALLRAAPIGIFGARIWVGVVELWATEDAALTHPDPVCITANKLFAAAIATAVRQPTVPRALFESVTDYAEGSTILQSIIQRARRTPPADYVEHPDVVTVALHNALWQLTHVPSFEEALVHTVAHGGDTAGNAAACGALLGAVHGLAAIPAPWVKAVLGSRPEAGRDGVQRPRPREYWPTGALELAKHLIAEHAQGVVAESLQR